MSKRHMPRIHVVWSKHRLWVRIFRVSYCPSNLLQCCLIQWKMNKRLLLYVGKGQVPFVRKISRSKHYLSAKITQLVNTSLALCRIDHWIIFTATANSFIEYSWTWSVNCLEPKEEKARINLGFRVPRKSKLGRTDSPKRNKQENFRLSYPKNFKEMQN